MQIISLRGARALFLVPLAALASVVSVNCGSDPVAIDADAGNEGGGGDGTTGADGPGFGDTGAGACRSLGAGCTTASSCCVNACTGNVCGGPPSADGGGGVRACNTDGGACVKGFDCCSGTCTNGKCVGNTLTGGDGGGGGNAQCLAPAAACTQSPQCCSGLCEPVTGQGGVIECKDACRALGVACTTAQDCCSLGCFGGVCANKLCDIVGDPCTANAECCSGVCNPQTKQCDVDLPNSRCRPTGEDCGKGPQSGCCGATDQNDLCVNGRCGLPPGACRGQNAACTADADCCGKHCDPTSHTCTTPCTPAGGVCKTGADCCTSSCTNGSCDAPLPPPPPPPPPGTDAGAPGSDAGGVPICKAVGVSCVASAECCSGLCLAGFCDIPVR